jgi:arylsulfatase A-like enzyme
LGPFATLAALTRRPESPETGRPEQRWWFNQKQAISLLTGTKIKNTFDLTKANPKLLDRYDRTLFGSSALIARRLVEVGVRFVNVTWDFPGDNSWDTHAANFTWLRGALPSLDLTYSALMEDLEDRGLLKSTLVVLMSDMGRTPQVNGAAGRDHWSFCYSVVFAGAGIRGGTVCGASDAPAAYVKDRPVSTSDVCATIYHCLGIDPEMTVNDRGGKPIPVAHGGKPIREILA